MTKIKIKSNPYERNIEFLSYKEQSDEWQDIRDLNANSKLREIDSVKSFLPFKIKEIIDIILDEYQVSDEKVAIVFEGTQDEYAEIENICKEDNVKDKIILSRAQTILENARIIFEPIKEIFAKVQPIIEKIVKDDKNVCKDLNKVSDALKDIIPICVFGNYSAGKSTFINALIGGEVLPSGGDPVTAKVYKIERSKYPDNARIRFSYKEEEFEILFEGTDYRLLKGNIENGLIQDIFNAIKESNTTDMNAYVSIALELVNGYERKDKNDIVISNVVEIEIPFSKSGILGQSYNNFVIFDTPGSNSASNAEHSAVLEKALEGFSNGIPVWISQYDSLDSNDNDDLCDKVLSIKALDSRFTMIVVNKADNSTLPREGLSQKQIQNILEYCAVEKMYSAGIFFVSSIMGLGYKSNETFHNEEYEEVYFDNYDKYSNPEHRFYKRLYSYNIMPKQIKEVAMRYSADCSNLIYANSGLYCVEQEMENFASKHAAYNKCQMVYMFLKEVIEETDRRIISRTESLKRTREARRRELENAKALLIDNLNKTAADSEYEFDKISKSFVKSFVSANLNYRFEIEALENVTETLHNQNIEECHFSIQEQGYEDSKAQISSNTKKNVREIFKGEGKFLDRLEKMKDDFVRDYTALKESKGEKALAEKEIDKETSDKLLEIVVEQYKKNVLLAQEILSNSIKEHWLQNAQSLRNILIEIITGSDALSSTQREELSNIIMSYQPLSFNDDADNIFIKARFLKGNFFGFHLIDDEKLNIRKLSRSYNDKIAKTIFEIATEMNASSYSSFRTWKESLSAVIEENITEYNPQLRDMSDMIKEETEKIAELEDNQSTIQHSLNAIEELMSWKTLE